jgi:hypothetical protein
MRREYCYLHVRLSTKAVRSGTLGSSKRTLLNSRSVKEVQSKISHLGHRINRYRRGLQVMVSVEWWVC